MHKDLKYCLIIGLCFLAQLFSAQINKADSFMLTNYLDKGNQYVSNNNDSASYYSGLLLKNAEKANSDHFILKAYYLKAKICFYTANYEEAKQYQQKALRLAQKIKDFTLVGKLFNLSGALLYNQSDYDNALKEYTSALNINVLQKDTAAILQAYYNISLVYNIKAQFRKSIEVSYKGLGLAEKTRDTVSLMSLNEGLGMAYYQLEEQDKAIHFLNEAYRISVLKKADYYQGGILIDLGNIYQELQNQSKAISYYDEAISLARKNGDKRRLGIATGNKGYSLLLEKDYQSALINLDEAIKIHKEINYLKGLLDVLNLKAECLYRTGNYKEAISYALESIEIASKIKTPKDKYKNYLLLSKSYEATHNNTKAFYYYKRYVNLRDTIESKREIRAVSGIEFNYEKEKIDRQQKHERELAEAQLRKQKLIQTIITIAGIIMLGLFFFILRNYSEKQKANIEIRKQHEIIGQKNADILESINYSQKIQRAILAPPENIAQLLPEAFVLYRPKDIVSGDFYFIEQVFPQASEETWVAVALADCTGHGVPGALMSLTGYSILKQTLNEPSIHDPGEALDFLNRELFNFLKQNQKVQQIRDGMDISFSAINFSKNLLMFAGANNPLWIVSQKEDLKNSNGNSIPRIGEERGFFVYEVKANKQPIGYSERTEKFTNHVVQLQKGDGVYLFTDGYSDQFGGEKGKKLKYKMLREIILKNADKDMQEQKLALEKAFDDWKGHLEQVDDVSVLGFRL